MSSDNPKVTVIIPVYNGEKYLSYAVESILNQTFNDFELLIINDGSTDHSLEIIQSYRDQRIRIVDNKENLGLVRTRNKGLSEARGQYIAFLDCDDIANPNRLKEQVDFLDKHIGFGMVGSWVEVINEQNCLTGEKWKHEIDSDKISSILLFENCFTQSSIMLKKAILFQTLYEESYPVAEDYDLWVRLISITKASNIPNFLVQYRRYFASTSQVKKVLMETCVRKIILSELQSLSIKPTADEFEIHELISSHSFIKCEDTLKKVDKWLLKLYRANLENNCYPNGSFKIVLGERWFDVCNSATGLGLSAWKIYWNSIFAIKVDLYIKRRFKFFIKCAIKYKSKNAEIVFKKGEYL
jgi:glycosyltransferase involved in cell wall biosynthesis